MLNRHKNWLVHKQTACGKDFSNPFMVDNLPKIVGFSTHLASLVKSWLVQDQTVLGKDYSNLLIVDSLLKTIWFINAPCYGNEALASPKANGICSNILSLKLSKDEYVVYIMEESLELQAKSLVRNEQ
ncbi:hypothetical protein Tco_0371148 [Tanacetum coccineum]